MELEVKWDAVRARERKWLQCNGTRAENADCRHCMLQKGDNSQK